MSHLVARVAHPVLVYGAAARVAAVGAVALLSMFSSMAMCAAPACAEEAVAGHPAAGVLIGVSVPLFFHDGYDIAEGLGQAEAFGGSHDDLGPGGLGFELEAGLALTAWLELSVRASIAVGGIVNSEERYFQAERQPIGSSLTVDAIGSVLAKLPLATDFLVLGRVAGGAERLVESSGAGMVWIEGAVFDGDAGLRWRMYGDATHSGYLQLTLGGRLHGPVDAQVGSDPPLLAGDPVGTFASFRTSLGYIALFDL